MTTCAVDARPTADNARLCAACTAEVRQALASIPDLAAELETTLSRQTAGQQRHGGRSADKPLAYDVGASEALGALRACVVGWVRVLAEEEGL